MTTAQQSLAPDGLAPSHVARTGRGRLPYLLWILGAVTTTVATALAIGLRWQTPVDGLPDAGPLVVDGLPLLRLVTVLAGAALMGFLLSAFALDPRAAADLSPEGRRDAHRASVSALLLAAASTFLAVLSLADVLGMSLREVTGPGVIATYIWDVQPSRAHLIAGLLASAVALGLRRSRTPTGAAGWAVVAGVAVGLPSLTGHASGLGSHALALVAGFTHAVAASIWVGGVLALMVHRTAGQADIAERIRRFAWVAMPAVVAVALTGLAGGMARLAELSELATTPYGRMLLLKTIALVAAVVLAAIARRSGWRRLLMIELVVLGGALGLGVVVARTPFPRAPSEFGSVGESLIGYAYPPAPTMGSVGLGWHPDWIWITAALLAMGLYVAGFVMLVRRGDRWPSGRLVSWILGWAVVLWATCGGVAWYAPVSFSLHMVSHMALAMLGPILLVLGGPMTLALRVLSPAPGPARGPREWIVVALHSRATRLLTHPAYVLAVYTVGLYGLYYTDLYPRLMSSHLGHLAMQVHFLTAGYLFFWVVIGVDEGPRRLEYPTRLVLVMASMVIHAFFAVPMMLTNTPMVADWYALVTPPWLLDPLTDSHNAGGIAWAFGEIPALIVAIVLAVQWSRSDQRRARRLDRKADLDDDLDLREYNDRLARLARLAQQDGVSRRRGGAGEDGQ